MNRLLIIERLHDYFYETGLIDEQYELLELLIEGGEEDVPLVLREASALRRIGGIRLSDFI